MRAGASANHVGHFHEAGFYASDAEFHAMIMPFVAEGVAAGEPIFLYYDQRKLDLVRGWLKDPSAVTLMAADGGGGMYANPARAIESYRQLFEECVAAGATQIRIAGDAPHAGNGGRFDGWDRYESAVNVVWEGYPVRSLCLYDATTTSATVRDVVERTHPRLLTPAGERLPNSRYEDTATFVALAPGTDALEASAPLIDLDSPTPAEARAALTRVARARVAESTVGDLQLAISEAVSNAHRHGRMPMGLRIWAAADRVVAHVRDGGPGPANRLAGLTRAEQTATGAGVGLWLVHQLDIDVGLMRDADGFTVRLRGGALPPPVA